MPKPLPKSYRHRGENYHDLRVNYAFEEVRDFYVGLATDLAERHPDVDGIELDFMRSRKFFPDGEEEPEKLTAMVRRIRENVDRIAAAAGKPIRIVARVPTFHDGYAAGMRVRQWLDEGLLDGIILGHGNMISDNPMEEWAVYAKEREVKVYGANRLSYRLPDELTRERLRNGPNEIDVSLAPNPFDEDLVIEGVTGTFLY